MPRLKYFEGMKMMNDMMKMNGDLDDMGMNMSLNQMDMNVVMYPEITGEKRAKKDTAPSMEHHGDHNMNMDEDPNRYNANALGDIKTLNYAMLKSPHTTLPADAPVKELKFTLTGNMNRYVWSMDKQGFRNR
jgi:FtsP/CotA-like multicopper oxidase with cupredoxin domain